MKKIKSLLHKVFIKPITIKYWSVIGLIIGTIGISIIQEFQEIIFFKSTTELSQKLNETYYLSLKNPSNILVGLSLITLTILIYWYFYKLVHTAEDSLNQFSNKIIWVYSKKKLLWIIIILSIYGWVMRQIALHRYSSLFLWIWLISILIFTFFFWKNENQNQFKSYLAITYIDSVWMLALFSFAVFVGTYLLNDLPAGWIADEGPFWKVARSIALEEEKPPFFDFGVFTFPVSSSIFQGWVMKWAGINFWGWRFSAVLPAVLTIFPLYLLGHELFDRRVAIASCLMMVTNPYFLAFARLGYNNSQSLLPVTLCTYLLVIGLRRNSYFYLWLAGLVSGFGFYTYFAAWLGLVVLIIVLISFSWIHAIKFQKTLISLTTIIVGALIVFLPRMLFGMSSDSPVNLHYKIWETGPINTFYGNFVFGTEIIAQSTVFKIGTVEVFYNPSLYGVLLIRGVIRTFAALFDPIGYNDHTIFFGLAGPGASLFFVLGFGIIIANFRKLQNLIPSVWFLTGFFFLGILSSLPPRPTHMVAIIPVLSFISAIGLVSLINILINKDLHQLLNKITISSILTIITMMGFFHYFFMIPYIYSPPNEDDYISWLGRQISVPTNLYLIDHLAVTRNPVDESLQRLTQHKVSLLSVDDLSAESSRFQTWSNFVVFFSLKNNGRTHAEELANLIPKASLKEAYSPGKRLRGYIVTDLLIDTEINISFSNGITSVWNSPARAILLICLINIIIIFLIKKFIIKESKSN